MTQGVDVVMLRPLPHYKLPQSPRIRPSWPHPWIQARSRHSFGPGPVTRVGERESWAQSLALRQTDSVLIGLSGSKQSPYTRFCPLGDWDAELDELLWIYIAVPSWQYEIKLLFFQELNAVYNITKDQDVNLVPSQPHILHNLTGEAGDTSALPPNLHQTYFEVSLMYFSFDVDNFVVRVTALACTRSSLTPINWRTTSTRSRSVKFRSTNDNKWTRNLSL